MGKPNFRDSLVNMLGEFVNINKNPDCKLSTSSQEFIADAVKTEKKLSTASTASSVTRIYIGLEPMSTSSPRTRSSNSSCLPSESTTSSSSWKESRRFSAPLLKPRKLGKKTKNNACVDNGTITESDESDESVLNEFNLCKGRKRNDSQSSSLLSDIVKYCNEMTAIHTRI